MSGDVVAADWNSLDPWWAVYAQTRSVPRSSDSTTVFGVEHLVEDWDELETWWRTDAERPSVTRGATRARVSGSSTWADEWGALDPWWDEFVETGHEIASEIADLLAQSNAEWERSDAPFDTDPLARDVTGDPFPRGPLQPRNEVEWSQWLAQLLRQSAALVTELFDVAVDGPPDEVVRETRLSKADGAFRRPDVLVRHPKQGVSIEVKLGDENYQKTPDTARLVERHDAERAWVHTLLLPKQKVERLDAIVEPPIEVRDDGRRQIEWSDPGPIDVIFWDDVTTAIRSLLRRGAVEDDHWSANAYLFCAAVEQRIVGFQPQPVVDRMATPEDVVDKTRPFGIVDRLEEQLTYLRAMQDS